MDDDNGDGKTQQEIDRNCSSHHFASFRTNNRCLRKRFRRRISSSANNNSTDRRCSLDTAPISIQLRNFLFRRSVERNSNKYTTKSNVYTIGASKTRDNQQQHTATAALTMVGRSFS
jgi:hypothetical protein